MTELYAVPDFPPPRSLIERAESEQLVDIDEYLRRTFGCQALSLIADELLVFHYGSPVGETDRIQASGCVAGLYTGLESVTVSPKSKRSLYVIRPPESQMVATFATAMTDDVPDDLREKMENNDTDYASMHHKIAVELATPISFEPLANNREYMNQSIYTPLHVVR
ncbi:MAG: hypothetical protein ACHQTE_00325 [Candidatus Saccharimonadales bacterium]